MRLSQLGPAACEEAFRSWRLGSGPLLPYVRSTPFASLARYQDEMELPTPDLTPMGELPAVSDHELLLIDLPAAEALSAGLAAAELGRWPVVAFSHWYHPRGMVGDTQTAALLLLRSPRVDSPRGWTLLLDHDRYRDGSLEPDRFNNQYELSEEDVPTAEELKHLDIHAVVIVTRESVKTDLRRYAAYLESAELGVSWRYL